LQDNEIDGAVLPKLTVDDLKDLGVATVGDRRKLRAAIAELAAPSRRRSLARRPVRPKPLRSRPRARER
jgi:SAM domain (Sterile alpha motif)